jgi:hypothetical protein
MDEYTLLDLRTWFLVICCGVALVLGLYALITIVIALVSRHSAHFVHGHSHDVWMPEPHKPVSGKAGLYSAPQHR